MLAAAVPLVVVVVVVVVEIVVEVVVVAVVVVMIEQNRCWVHQIILARYIAPWHYIYTIQQR